VDEHDNWVAARHAARSLLEDGPVRVDELIDELMRRELIPDPLGDLLEEMSAESLDETLDVILDEILDEILDDDIWVDDNLIALTSQLLSGVTLTHFVSAHDVERSVVAMVPDLEFLDCCAPPFLDTLSGGVVEIIDRDPVDSLADPHGSLRGPPGWLNNLRAATLASFRVEEGRLFVEPVDHVGAGEGEIAALRRFGRVHIREDVGTEALPVLMSALIHQPELFRQPVAPLGDLMMAAGFERRDAWFGVSGTPWRTPAEEYLQRFREELTDEGGFDDCCLAAFDAVVDIWLNFIRLREPLDVAACGAAGSALRHGGVSGAFVLYVLGGVPASDDNLDAFARELSNS
jgi:hypothetical protein